MQNNTKKQEKPFWTIMEIILRTVTL